jgi:hypothetical protein
LQLLGVNNQSESQDNTPGQNQTSFTPKGDLDTASAKSAEQSTN